MENKVVYVISGIAPEIRKECFLGVSSWLAPRGDEIKAALKLANWTEVEYSRKLGVNDRTVRRWTSEDKEIPYTAWCILAAQAGFGMIWQNEAKEED